MVLVYLKNLIFPSRRSSSPSSSSSPYQKSRCSNGNHSRFDRYPVQSADIQPDLEDGARNINFSAVEFNRSSPNNAHERLLNGNSDSHNSFELEPYSAPSSISGDTFVETPRRGLLVDPRVISDATIGLSDGLTVPFALTAGLSALGDTRIVIFGGLAELTAGAISMGMGGYLAARSETDAYNTALASTQQLVKSSPSSASIIVRNTLTSYFPSSSPSHAPLETVIDHLSHHPDQLVDFIMRFHHSLTAPSDTRGAWTSALTIAASYFLGGFVPLLPYFVATTVGAAFLWSVGMMVVALFLFGAGKTWLTNVSCEDETGVLEGKEDKEWMGGKEAVAARGNRHVVMKCIGGGLQMVVLGGLAATAAVGLVKVFN